MTASSRPRTTTSEYAHGPYKVELSRRAHSQYCALSQEQRVATKRALRKLRLRPWAKGRRVSRDVYAMTLRLPGRNRRLVYEVIETQRLVLISKIEPRFL